MYSRYSISTLFRDKRLTYFKAPINNVGSAHTSSRESNNGIAGEDSSKRTAGRDEEQQCCTIEAPRSARLLSTDIQAEP